MTTDPFETLGLDRSATAADVRSAQRRLAKQHHPDVGGDAERMRIVNGAVAAALSALSEPTTAGQAAPPRRSAHERPTTGATTAGPAATTTSVTVDGRRAVHDTASFTIEALPAEAFEALVIAASIVGELLVDDPPYLLEAHVAEPPSCWCRLELVPDAGASTVSLTVAPVEVGPVPDLDAVRDLWVSVLNELDWARLGEGPTS